MDSLNILENMIFHQNMKSFLLDIYFSLRTILWSSLLQTIWIQRDRNKNAFL